ncbi:DUF1624 domain-containing protein [Zobellia galactanivorans]|uniref:Conserved hypothetical membrane protein n=1 Tax=Zobellia galactanivorans (strain DSM 12802 / CCUG 47099 / CIP 106680 / NCIMB 13871 / Dsij) TaxID=63186 RepID=G0L204_ZOBGA|nr:heparan-alpha-glucosaminide N-acetyltransferase domain-containing protein [Zobellia galactanivorans]CAZ94849.1 Conserved hypothetical membrane protein [Zobellia galactanivorans]
MIKTTYNRIKSIDMLRGLVMVIMALDHVRDYFHYDAFLFDPTDLTQTNGPLFFTRFITHYCAPVFVFLAGTSAFFVGQRKGLKYLSNWLLKRGFWLIFLELTVVKFAWLFKFDLSYSMLQVIWILGLAMIFLAGLIHLPKRVVLILSALVVGGHNLFDFFESGGSLNSGIWSFLHGFKLLTYGDVRIFVAYPILPWVFVMPLGYYFGTIYKQSFDSKTRAKILLQMGAGITVAFLILRVMNYYGDPYLWTSQGSWSYTLMSFFNVTKYPPSLLFLLITIGPSIMLLAFAEKWKGWVFDKLVIIGRVPMFFYIIHIYVIHLLALFAAVLTGFRASDMYVDLWVTMQPGLKGYGFGLGVVYLIWAVLVVALYPLCAWFDRYKSNHREKWWLRYL